jgi:DNA invertase Pin-like site-specific DNA recombinase
MKAQQDYSVGVYCRLSVDDGTNNESMSIGNQRSMLIEYTKKQGWRIEEFYIDDGYSGTNFQRPNFQRMIDDVERGRINCIVCKDLSRLGRNYLETGTYIEIYFPSKNVRFIALNDGIDSLHSNNDIAPFKNILNDMYAKDISMKVKSSLHNKAYFIALFVKL